MPVEETNSTFDAVPRRQTITRSMRLFAAALLVVAAISPADGLGINVCIMRATMDLPCPGCGVTRSMTLLTRGRFAESWHMHPLGGPILVALMFIALSGLVPEAWHRGDNRLRGATRAVGRTAAAGLLALMALLWGWRLYEALTHH
ncbi:MAG: DUF2752 domain-containing protein [Phycisphaeraceae bacterium]|nr:DUF2752 domain-containing protein [Phycisphaeraceae bacterium]